MGIEIQSCTAERSSQYSSGASTATTESGATRPPTAPSLPVAVTDEAVSSRPVSGQASSRFKGVVPQPNGRWGAQIYERHARVWLGTFPDENTAARAYDVAALRYRGREAATNYPCAAEAAELAFLAAHSKAEIVDMLRKHTYDDELRQGLRRGRGMGARAQPTPAWAREPLFEKAVTPSDVGKLNRLVVPKQHAEKHFPLKRSPETTTTTTTGKGVLLNFEDGEGKVWRFRYSYWNSSQSYVLTKGWSRATTARPTYVVPSERMLSFHDHSPIVPLPSPSARPGAPNIANRWRELHGATSWKTLLDPLDADLRASLIAYGELAEAAYDGFNSEQRSRHAGSCLYSPAELLAASGVSHPEYYTVTKYVYAPCGVGLSPQTTKLLGASPGMSAAVVPPATTAFFVLPKPELRVGPWWRECNWMGFVAVATDEGAAALGRRDIVVAWRGTVEKLEFVSDGDFRFTSAKPVVGPLTAGSDDAAQVHNGFLSVYLSGDEYSKHYKTSARDQVVEEVRRLMVLHKDEETSITVTGHSLGAALATLNAVDMVAHAVNVPPASSKQRPCPVTAFLFACPRVGNESFRSAFASFDLLRALHVKNKYDLVPTLPPEDFSYVDAATATLLVDTTRSPFLALGSILTYHNLEGYLHGIAGDHGADKEFWLEVDRDIALVNKSADALIDKYAVPANWWVINNKGMVKDAGGHWKLKDLKLSGY